MRKKMLYGIPQWDGEVHLQPLPRPVAHSALPVHICGDRDEAIRLSKQYGFAIRWLPEAPPPRSLEVVK